MVVDDDPQIISVYQLTLEQAGIMVSVAENGEDAVIRLQEEDFDLVIVDLNLPDVDGRTFLARLRDDRKTESLSVLVVSALASESVAAECLAFGADQVLRKPVSPAELLRQAEATLEKQHERATSEDDTGILSRASLRETQRALDRVPAQVGVCGGCLGLILLENLFELQSQYAGWFGAGGMNKIFDTLRAALPDIELIARWSFDELVVLLPWCTVENAKITLEPMLAAAEGLRRREHVPLFITVAITPTAGDELQGPILESRRAATLAGQPNQDCLITTGQSSTMERPEVYVIDDDPMIITLLQHRLEQAGFDVVTFGDGLEAFEALMDHEPAAVVSDYRLPGLDGMELARKFRAQAPTSKTPILMLTSHGNDANVVAALEAGANDFMAKPFSVEELLARLQGLIRRKR